MFKADFLITCTFIMFTMLFVWLCIVSIRLSIAYKIIVKLYKKEYLDVSFSLNEQKEPPQDNNELPPLAFPVKRETFLPKDRVVL